MKTIEKLGSIGNKNGFVTALAERLREAFANGSEVNNDTKESLLKLLVSIYRIQGRYTMRKFEDVRSHIPTAKRKADILHYPADEEGGEVANMIDEIGRDLGDHATDWPDVPPLTSLLDSSTLQSDGRFSARD